MKFSMAALLLVWLSASVCGAQEFSLQDDFGRVTGPYALQAGTEVAIGSNRLQLVNIQTQVVTVLPPGATERELQVRRFPVRAAVMAGILEAAAAQAPDATNRSDQLKRLLVDVGVVWPAGSWISDLPRLFNIHKRGTCPWAPGAGRRWHAQPRWQADGLSICHGHALG